MGENKIDNDQEVGITNTDQQQIYGSHQHGRHNLEVNSPSIFYENNEEGVSNKQHIKNQQFPDIQAEDLFSDSYKIEDENYQDSSPGRINDNEKAKMVSCVEGDDEDILGETENALRNEHERKAKETNQGDPQSR